MKVFFVSALSDMRRNVAPCGHTRSAARWKRVKHRVCTVWRMGHTVRFRDMGVTLTAGDCPSLETATPISMRIHGLEVADVLTFCQLSIKNADCTRRRGHCACAITL